MSYVCVLLLEYGCTLEEDIVSDTSSLFRRVLVSLATVRLREMGVNLSVADGHASHFSDEVFRAGFGFTYLAFHLTCISHPTSAGRGGWLWVRISATCSF